MSAAVFDEAVSALYLASVAVESEGISEEGIATYAISVDDTESMESSTSVETEILEQVKVTNEFLAHMFALQLFGLGLVFCILVYRLVKNNVTRYI